MMAEVSPLFGYIKGTLIVLHVLSLIAVVCLVIISILGLYLIEQNDNSEHKLTLEEKHEARDIFRMTSIIASVSLVFQVIGLVGVIKENKLIIAAIVVFSTIETVVYLVKSNLILASIELMALLLTAVYAFMIIKKEKCCSNA